MREGGRGAGGPERAEGGPQARIAEIAKRRAELGRAMGDYMEGGLGDKEEFERNRAELDRLDAELKRLEGKV